MKDQQDDSKAIDLNYLTTITGGDRNKLIELLKIFLKQTPQTYEQLHTSVGLMQGAQVKAQAAQLKANLNYIGRENLIKRLSQLEAEFEINPISQKVRDLLKEIRQELDTLQSDIKGLVGFLLKD